MSATTPESTTTVVSPEAAAPPAREIGRGNLLSSPIPEIEATLDRLPGALSAENIGFTTYRLMAVVQRQPAPPALARISAEMGLSYWGIRRAIERCPWFELHPAGENPLVTVSLTEDGATKLARITKRLEA